MGPRCRRFESCRPDHFSPGQLGKCEFAGVAQLVEQLICNQQVGGSSPSTSSIFCDNPVICAAIAISRVRYEKQIQYGRVPEWPKGADCKSVAFQLRWSESILSHQIMCLILLSGTFFLVFMRVCGFFSVSKKDWCPITVIPVFKDICKAKRSFHLIFQAGNSAFLRLPLFFPVVGTVKVFGRYIDRLTKAPNGPISSPQDTRG